MIRLDERRDVHQIPAVRPAAYQIAAADYPADCEILYLAEWQFIAGRDGFVISRFLLRFGQ